MGFSDPTSVEMAEALTKAVEAILKTANAIPTRLLATYKWEETNCSEELVPRIEIEWVRPIPCETCGRFESDGNCPNHHPLR